MMMSRKLLLLTLFIVVSACVYDHVEGKKEKTENDAPGVRSILRSFRDLAKKAGKDQDFVNPFRLIARILSFVTFPARFILRFITTILSVVILSVIGCQIVPRVDCDFAAAKEAIPHIMADIESDINFYLEMAQNQESA